MSLPVTGADYVTTQIVASTDQTVTTLLVASPTEPFPLFDVNHTYFYLTIVDEPSYIIDADPPTQREIVKVYAYSVVATGYELTCVRGSAGTSAQIWAVGAVAEIRPCAQWFEDVKGGAGGTISVTDGITTVDPTSILNFTSNATVTDAGGGQADVAITGGGGGGAPTDATYVTMSLNGTLTQERVLTAGTGITITDGGANSTVTIANSQTSMVQAQYVTLALDGGLTSERVLTAGAGITITDGGANSTVTIATTGMGSLVSQEFITNGTFTTPFGVGAIWITMIGGGGGGASVVDAKGAGGGGAGELVQNLMIPVSGDVAIVVGAKGTGAPTAGAGSNGGDTSVDGIYIAKGGLGGASTGVGGNGGGINGGVTTTYTNPGTPGLPGTAEAPTYFGGSGGGGGSATAAAAGGAGAGSGGYVGGAAGTTSSSQGGGGGGASTIWGVGGAGGNGGANGTSAVSTVYGAGGGGAGGKTGLSGAGGDGCAGYVLVSWIA